MPVAFRGGVAVAVLVLLPALPVSAESERQMLTGLSSVAVMVSWPNASDSDVRSVKSGVELRLRQCGIGIITVADAQSLTTQPSILFIDIANTTQQITSVSVQLHEGADINRELASAMDFTAYNTYMKWLLNHTVPPTEDEIKAHHEAVDLEDRNNLQNVHVTSRSVITWERHGIAKVSQGETTKEIIARYATHPYWQTPAGRPIVQHMLDLEVQDAIARVQATATINLIWPTIDSQMSAFVNDWLAANQKTH
jgi:hypothetical protein